MCKVTRVTSLLSTMSAPSRPHGTFSDHAPLWVPPRNRHIPHPSSPALAGTPSAAIMCRCDELPRSSCQNLLAKQTQLRAFWGRWLAHHLFDMLCWAFPFSRLSCFFSPPLHLLLINVKSVNPDTKTPNLRVEPHAFDFIVRVYTES